MRYDDALTRWPSGTSDGLKAYQASRGMQGMPDPQQLERMRELYGEAPPKNRGNEWAPVSQRAQQPRSHSLPPDGGYADGMPRRVARAAVRDKTAGPAREENQR